MDPENLALQERLHAANEARLAAIEEEQRSLREQQASQGQTLARIDENTKHLPKLNERLSALEKTDSKHGGAIAILLALWTGLAGWISILHGK